MKNYICLEDAIEALRKYQYPYGVEFLISNLPRCDVEPVVHAIWIDEDFPQKQATVHGFAVCSACGELSHKAEHGYNILSRYCPNCGAKMDLTED